LPALDGLASVFAGLHRSSDAEAAWRRALSIRESAYGPSTLEVAGTLDQLGKFYFEQKKYPEAAYCYERTLFIRSKAHGELAPDTQAALTEVANVYGAQGRHADAEPLYRSMLTAREIELVGSLNSLAALLATREHNAEAESMYKTAIGVLDKNGFVSARKPVLNPADPPPAQLAETLDQYAALLKKMRKKADAAKIEARARMLRGIPDPAARAAAPAKKTK
jgi:tetratricopeptide (TPR) repeat protein